MKKWLAKWKPEWLCKIVGCRIVVVHVQMDAMGVKPECAILQCFRCGCQHKYPL